MADARRCGVVRASRWRLGAHAVALGVAGALAARGGRRRRGVAGAHDRGAGARARDSG